MVKAASPVMRRCKCRGAEASLTYRADPPDGLRIVPLDSLTAIYHRASGQTHVVAEPMPQILAALGLGEADVPDLIFRLGLTNTDETRVLLTERLKELVVTGLVARS
jgi:PqqD family protein of HPr-rel-A system